MRVGDMFLSVNGELSTLTNVVRVEQNGGVAVFNFTVEGNHNYFILAKEYEYGQSCVLVHNADYPVTARRFMNWDEYKKARKNGIPFDPDGHGIPATTPTIRPTNPDRLKNLTGANHADYYLDIDVTDIAHQMKRTNAGLPEITILGNVPPSVVLGGGRVN